MRAKTETLRFGTRGSALARWQTDYIIGLLRSARPHVRVECEVIQTRGDHIVDTPLPLIGGKGVFTAELEAALRGRRIDCAVHSLKDLPVEEPPGLCLAAIPVRANPSEVLVSREGYTLETLPRGARVGTCSLRRAAQLVRKRPDVSLLDLRGNVDTRVRKALDADSRYDAIVLAHAGLSRLGYAHVISQVIDLDDMLPAPGQGAIAVQTRREEEMVELLRPIHHVETAMAVAAERAFLSGLGGGCSVPVAAHGEWGGDEIVLRGRVSSPDGKHHIDIRVTRAARDVDAAREAGMALAREALERGAGELLEAKA
jgi:hydroxymethylbilane synthase